MNNTIGVIIGRFQVNEIHEGHVALLQYVRNNHNKVIIFIGVKPTPANSENPLDFETRKMMLEIVCPGAIIIPIMDNRSDEVWSRKIDDLMESVYPFTHAILYGGRDSFIPHYAGRHQTKEVFFTQSSTGTSIRESISKNPINSPDFRAGVIYGISNLPTRIYNTIDIAILRPKIDEMYADQNKSTVFLNKKLQYEVLLGQKSSEEFPRFPGGFVDMADDSHEDTVRRELHEETGLIAEHKLHYIGSFTIDDWRSRGSKDVKHMTIFYATIYAYGQPKAGDDISKVIWHNVSDKTPIMAEHKPLMIALIEKLNEGEIQ